MSAAAAVRGSKIPVKDDNDDGAAWPTRHEMPDGAKPVLMRVAAKGEAPALAEEIKRLQTDEGVPADHIAVLTVYNDDARKVALYLQTQRSVPSVLLQGSRNDGKQPRGVRVGTFDRAKGLEFDAVLIPRLGSSVFPRPADGSRRAVSSDGAETTQVAADADVAIEARQLELDRLYVGMTRARRWLFLVADETPCTEIEAAWEYFDRRKG